MRVVCAAAMIVMLAGPAYAQEKPVPKYGEETKDKTPQEKEADKAADSSCEAHHPSGAGAIVDQALLFRLIFCGLIPR